MLRIKSGWQENRLVVKDDDKLFRFKDKWWLLGRIVDDCGTQL